MSPEEIKAIAAEVVVQLKAGKSDFSIPAEAHYNSHKSMDDLVADWKMAKGIFWKAFLGLAILGAVVLAAVGLGYHKPS
ncbi:MAG: hypothetical protein NTW90_06795 [Nitrosospira sp.]|nr:hypothetical protein [Nitrosospira sp.]